MRALAIAAAALLALVAGVAGADSPVVGKKVETPAGFLPGMAIYCDNGSGYAALCSFMGGGGGGGGDASAANQSKQITAEELIRDRLGDVSSPTAGTTNGRLSQIYDRLGATLTIAGTVSVSGSVAVTGTFWQTTQPISAAALPLPAGAATAAKQDAIVAAIGTPYQANGALPLPAGAATAARQDALLAAIGSPAQAGGKIDTVIQATSADRGALVGTTAVQLMAANASRRGFTIQNQSGTAVCYFSGLGTATADYHSIMIPAGQGYETKDSHVGSGAISIICSAASTPVAAREW